MDTQPCTRVHKFNFNYFPSSTLNKQLWHFGTSNKVLIMEKFANLSSEEINT